MVIIRGKNHRDYKSSGIICEINMGAHGAKVRMRKRTKEEMQLVVSRAFASVQNPPQFCYCVTIGETCKCIFVILILNISASTTCNQSLKQNKNSKCWD